MAAHALTTNIVRLPTAASRKVQQPAGFAMHAAAKALPQHPAKWEDHGGGKPYDQATIRRSPEMLVIMAMSKVLTEDQKARVRRAVDQVNVLMPDEYTATALHIVENVK